MATFFDIDGVKCFHCAVCCVDMPAEEIYRLQNNFCKDCNLRSRRYYDAKKYAKEKTKRAVLNLFFSLDDELQNCREKSVKKAFKNQELKNAKQLEKARIQSAKQYEKVRSKFENERKNSKKAEERRRELVEKYKAQKAERDEKIEQNAQKIIDAFKNEFADRQQAKSENNMPRYIAVEERENARLEEYRKRTKRLAMAEGYREKQAEKYYSQYANEIVHSERSFFASLKCTKYF